MEVDVCAHFYNKCKISFINIKIHSNHNPLIKTGIQNHTELKGIFSFLKIFDNEMGNLDTNMFQNNEVSML